MQSGKEEKHDSKRTPMLASLKARYEADKSQKQLQQ